MKIIILIGVFLQVYYLNSDSLDHALSFPAHFQKVSTELQTNFVG